MNRSVEFAKMQYNTVKKLCGDWIQVNPFILVKQAGLQTVTAGLGFASPMWI
jgi:hypothetical protein